MITSAIQVNKIKAYTRYFSSNGFEISYLQFGASKLLYDQFLALAHLLKPLRIALYDCKSFIVCYSIISYAIYQKEKQLIRCSSSINFISIAFYPLSVCRKSKLHKCVRSIYISLTHWSFKRCLINRITSFLKRNSS